MAISGLAILALFFGAPEYYKYQIDTEIFNLESEVEILEIDVEEQAYKLASFKEKVKLIEETPIENRTEESIDESDKLLSALEKVNTSIRKTAIKKRAIVKTIDYKFSLLKRLKNFQTYGVIFGLIFTLLGFTLWYFLVQRKIDRFIPTE